MTYTHNAVWNACDLHSSRPWDCCLDGFIGAEAEATMAIMASRAGRKPEYDSRRQLPPVVDPHEPPVFVESILYRSLRLYLSLFMFVFNEEGPPVFTEFKLSWFSSLSLSLYLCLYLSLSLYLIKRFPWSHLFPQNPNSLGRRRPVNH